MILHCLTTDVNIVDNAVDSPVDMSATSSYGAAVPIDRCERGFGWRESDPAQRPEHSPTALLLHGLGGSRLSWEPQIEGLDNVARMVAWDLPGYGVSSSLPEPMTFELLTRALDRFADVVGVSRFHLVGLSFGAMVAQYAAAALGDRIASLTLLATSPKFGLDGTQPDQWRAARLAPLDAGQQPLDFADAVLAALAGPNITATALHGQRAAMARITADALRACIDCLITHDSRSVLGFITAPTCCVVGEFDRETPVAYANALASGIQAGGSRVEVHVIAGAGHLLNVEAPEEVNEIIRHQIRSFEREQQP